MKTRVAVVMLLLGAVFGGTASANTDYQCMNSCMWQGSSASSCYKSCGYLPLARPEPVARTSPNNPFTALGVVGGAAASQGGGVRGRETTAIGSREGPAGRYQCLAQCMQSGLLHDKCAEQCGVEGP